MIKTLSLLTFILCVNFSFSQKIEVFEEKKFDDVIYIYAKNSTDKLYSIKFEAIISGMKSSRFLPATVLLQPYSKTLITKLEKNNSHWSYNYNWNYTVGNVNARHRKKTKYALPYKKGEEFLVLQGYDGSFSHKDRKAIDFIMPIGTSICAMRDGVVFDIKDNSNIGCPNKSCVDDGNYIIIQHSDGTLAEYYHLKHKGVLVKKGQKINKGDIIGLSGNTGWSSTPHLHIMIYKNSFKGKKKSYKTLFQISENQFITLKKGEIYRSY